MRIKSKNLFIGIPTFTDDSGRKPTIYMKQPVIVRLKSKGYKDVYEDIFTHTQYPTNTSFARVYLTNITPIILHKRYVDKSYLEHISRLESLEMMINILYEHEGRWS